MKRSWLAIILLTGCSSTADQGSADGVASEPLSGRLETGNDPSGTTASYSTNAFDAGATNAFFTPLGTNGRSCNSCHRQDQGWTISAAKVKTIALTDPSDPLFAPVDGSDCPPTSVTQRADATRSTMLSDYALVRIQIPIPSGADFSLVSATNPKGCAIPPGDPAIGGSLFLFRRPLPTANLDLLSTVMWDGRETLEPLTQSRGSSNDGPLLFDLTHQDDDADRGHEQATASIVGTPTMGDLLGFETNLYAAQLTVGSLNLDGEGAHGGPQYVADVVAPTFFIGENDPLGPAFTPAVFTIFRAWEPDALGNFPPHLTKMQRAIASGEQLFNTKTFTIADVAGLDPGGAITGTCTTCHNSFNVGDHSTSLPLNIGVTMAHPTDNVGNPIDGILDIRNLPVYTLRSSAGITVDVTDPGRALISGKFVDVGKTKGPILRGLSSRAPYFHNGSAKDLATVVRFYDARFDIHLTEDETSDLATFLGAL